MIVHWSRGDGGLPLVSGAFQAAAPPRPLVGRQKRSETTSPSDLPEEGGRLGLGLGLELGLGLGLGFLRIGWRKG